MAESVAGLRPLADRKGHAIDLAIPAGLYVSADRGRLRQIVRETDPDAFITSEDVRPVRRGYWRA